MPLHESIVAVECIIAIRMRMAMEQDGNTQKAEQLIILPYTYE